MIARLERAEGRWNERHEYEYEPLPAWSGFLIMGFVLIGAACWIHAAKAGWRLFQ